MKDLTREQLEAFYADSLAINATLRGENERLKKHVNDYAQTNEALTVMTECLKQHMNKFHEIDGAFSAAQWQSTANALIKLTPQQCLHEVKASAINSVTLDCYDAGLLNDFGGGNVAWWQDYMRSELNAAHDFYEDQISQCADSVRKGGAE